MKWSVPVIVIALSACILFGSVGFQETTRDTTVYTSVLTDIAPLADADPVQDTVNYNPLTNVTGWGSSVGYVTQTSASLYKLTTDYSYSNHTSNAIKTYGKYVNTPYVSGDDIQWEWNDGTDVGTTAPGGTLIGGWSGTYSHEVYEGGSLVGTQYAIGVIDGDLYLTDEDTWGQYDYILPIDASIIPNKSIVTLSKWAGSDMLALWLYNGIGYGYSYSYTSEIVGGKLNTYERVNWGLGVYQDTAGEFYFTGGLFYRISGYDGTAPIVDYGTSYRIGFLADDLNATFTYRTVTDATTTYVTPYTLATVNGGQATWANGYDNSRVQFIADAANFTYSVNGTVTPIAALSDLYPDMAAWISGYTGKILVTVDGETGQSYWQGVTSYSDTKTFTVSDYRYELIDPDYSGKLLVPAGTAITSLTVYYLDSAVGDVGVIDTWMPQDSNGILWQDATFPIDGAFATMWANDNIRISFNSFVTTGTGITVNGTTYPVDGQGLITIDGDSFKVAGSSIEWTPDGDTTWVAPNGSRYDLGTRSGTFTLDGVWYGAMGMDTFETRSVAASEAVFGQHAGDSWRSWVFVGVLVLGTIAILATGRQLDTMDLLILVFAGAVGIIMAVML